MLKRYPDHALTDEIYFQKASIYQRIGDYKDAIRELTQITENPKYDILTDDALFLLARIYEEQVKDAEKAKDLYSTLVTKFPGSLYVVEARKRFRKLRGDAVN